MVFFWRKKREREAPPPEIQVPEGPRHVVLPINETGRDFVLGDLHGCMGAFVLALRHVKFDYTKDRIISVGDLIDRGSHSFECLQLVDEPWFHAVRGNHEEMLLNSANKRMEAMWRRNGGEWFFQLDDEKQMKARHLCAGLPVAISLKHKSGALIGICHAEWPGDDWSMVSLAPDAPWVREQMIWGRTVITEGAPRTDQSAAITIHGHTPIERSCRLGSALFIDTGAVYGGSLTLISLEDALAFPQKADDELIRLR